MLSAIANWTVKRRRLLAGVAGAAVETAVACVPGVGIAARVLGALIEKGTQEALAPSEKLPAEQLDAINGWLAKMAGCYGELLTRLERMREAPSLEESNRQVREALRHNAELAQMFDAHLVEVRQATLSLGVIEQKLDEHFHVQHKIHAGMEELEEVFVQSPLMGEWHDFRRARPEAVSALVEADEHFLGGRGEEGARVLLELLNQRGVGEHTIAHLLGLAEFGQGRIQQAAARLTSAGGSLVRTATRLATLAGKGAGVPVWRSLPRGHVINYQYRIEEEVGRGGMASVYRAVPTRAFDEVKQVALKVPAFSDDPAFAERFEKEIQITRRLEHDSIVRVEGYAIFDEPHAGRQCCALVMEYVSGESLARLLERRKADGKPLSIYRVRGIMKAVCDALDYAHRQKILHRDIKPHNILVSGDSYKLMDFGIARELNDNPNALTRPGDLFGTVAYMPPEMHLPDPRHPPAEQADIYMCGVLLRELLTFHPNGKLERTDCPQGWRELIRDAGHRAPEDRPASISEFRERLLESKVAFENSVGMKFVLVEPGTFLMGSPTGETERNEDEHQHEVTLTKPYFIGVHMVTQHQYERLMGNNPSHFKGANRPVENVSWEDCVSFCKRLNDLPEERLYERRYRLPTEAEWECACRGGANSSDKPFPFKRPSSSLSSAQANFDGTQPYGGADKGECRQETTDVGSYKPNRLGVYDMHGNVWEWCLDWYEADYFRTGPAQNPFGPATGSDRVIRGGSWRSAARFCRSACRNKGRPSSRCYDLSFRVVIPLVQ